MTRLDAILEANRRYVRPGAFPPLPKHPQKQIAIFTCMDTRLVDFLEPAMGMARGDAKVIKNAGNILMDPNGGVIRSIVAAVFMLGVDEVFVIGHEDCGMASVDTAEFKKSMIARGIREEEIDRLMPDMGQWLGTFSNPADNVARVTNIIRSSPLIPDDVPIHGLLFCPNDGHLEVVVRGYPLEPVKVP